MAETFKTQMARVRSLGMCTDLASEDCAAINAVLTRYNEMVGALVGIAVNIKLKIIEDLIVRAEGSDGK